MRPVVAIELLDGGGIVGDRYATSRHRHVSLQSTAMISAASERLGSTIDPLLTRRNITVEGDLLPCAPGTRFETNTCVLEVVRRAAPCRLLDDTIGDGAAAAMRGTGGVICRVITSGYITQGDLLGYTPRAD